MYINIFVLLAYRIIHGIYALSVVDIGLLMLGEVTRGRGRRLVVPQCCIQVL